MQKIAYTIFEVAKQAFSQKMPNDQIIEIIEHHVNKTYLDAITELKDNGIIDEELMQFAASQSNMNKMAQEMQQQAAAEQAQYNQDNGNLEQNSNEVTQITPKSQSPVVESKALKLATVAMLFNKMNQDRVQTFLDKFEENDAQDVIRYMKLPDLPQRVGIANAIRCLQEIKTNLPKATELTPAKVVKKIKNFASKYSERELETVLMKERIGVKRLVFSALEDKYYENMPPKVASIVATHLTNSV